MLILAIDSSGMTASAALLTEEKVLSEMSVNKDPFADASADDRDGDERFRSGV